MLKIHGRKVYQSRSDEKQLPGSNCTTAMIIPVAFQNPLQKLPAKLLRRNGG